MLQVTQQYLLGMLSTAGGVLLVGAEVALQHEGVRVGVEAEAVHIGLK